MKNMFKFRKSMMLMVKLLLIAAITFVFIETWSQNYITTIFFQKGNYVIIFSYVLLLIMFSTLYGAFKIGIYRCHEIIYSFFLAIIITNFIMYLELSLIARELISFLPFVYGSIGQFLIVSIGSYCANRIYFFLYPPRTMLAVFCEEGKSFEIIKKMGQIPERFKIERGINVNCSTINEIRQLINRYESVLICNIDKNLERDILSYCYTNQKRTYILPSITDIVINNSYEIQISDTPVLMSRNRGLTYEQLIIKRIMDLIISIIGIIITGPIMLLCAIAIKLDDGGPVLFKQNRVTMEGKIFNILKFRSMIVDAEKDGAKKATDKDHRITRVGKVIRACRIDELPQLINILMGDMSVVGPRPERIENVYEYTSILPSFDLRHKVKAGLTGYAQLYGKYNTSPEDKLNMDLIYIETYSVLQDIKLLILTVKVLFMRESTEGFDQKANSNVRPSNSIKEREDI